MGSDGCDPSDRHCSVPFDKQTGPCVWVGPNNGRWIKVVDAGQRPCPPADKPEDHADSLVFAAIASFRDSLCPTTLFDLFKRAARPHRIRVAIVQQNAPEDVDCVDEYCSMFRGECSHRDQIEIKRFDASQAKGPTWARAQDSDMLPDAEFCLRTDSHMAFANDWDAKLIDQWYKAENEYAVLSTYVADASQIRDGQEVNVNGKWEVPHLCSIQWQDGHVRNMQAKAARNLVRPKLTTLWAAGLSFARCHAERTVPYDPHTPYIFWGEEFSRTARFFTHGYDIYTPARTLVAHDYKHTQGDPQHFKWNGRGGPRIAQNKTILKMRDKANVRIWSLLGMPGGDPHMDLGMYGLGKKRTLQQLIEFTGIQLTNRTVFANRCGNIDWVPWDCQEDQGDRAELGQASLAAKGDDGLQNDLRAELGLLPSATLPPAPLLVSNFAMLDEKPLHGSTQPMMPLLACFVLFLLFLCCRLTRRKAKKRHGVVGAKIV